jgi:hypothetical protein
MYNRFDLEESIMACWNIMEDIKLLNEDVMESPKELSRDEICNYLQGLETIYGHRFEKLSRIFEMLIAEKKIS